MDSSPAPDKPPVEEPAHKAINPRRIRLLAVLLTGAYAWSLTVLPLLGEVGDAPLVAVFGWAAIATLLVSPILPPGKWSMFAALDGFVGASVLAWWAGRHTQIEPPSAVFGSLGWLAYTLALGALSTPVEEAKTHRMGLPLEPRNPPSRSALLALLASVLLALLLLGRAWIVERPAQLVLAHILALGAALLVLRSGAGLATHLQAKDTNMAASPSVKRALVPLFLFFSLVVGWIYLSWM